MMTMTTSDDDHDVVDDSGDDLRPQLTEDTASCPAPFAPFSTLAANASIF